MDNQCNLCLVCMPSQPVLPQRCHHRILATGAASNKSHAATVAHAGVLAESHACKDFHHLIARYHRRWG